ncbi:MAG: hypothetical protein JWO26_1900, partial [Rhodospirillales bacterium]|nr:hypothetical protein [Rhodospirillales bacterium]
MIATEAKTPLPRQDAGHLPGMLQGLRVIEIADETGEYVGLTLAGLGAEIIKVEPPGGAPTRRIGPFLEDQPGPERSLHFWNYNRGKRSVTLDLETVVGVSEMRRLIASADIVLDASGGALARTLGVAPQGIASLAPGLIVARITPFGDEGPWKDHKASDLVHLALGGIMMNCGYDPDPAKHYDMPPIAPQLWHAYHIAGDQAVVGIIAALMHRLHTGEGQDIGIAIHEAVSKNTELDVMSWVMRHAPLYRQTCRHAIENPTHVPSIGSTKDGRWYIATGVSVRDQTNLIPFLARYGMQADLAMPPPEADTKARNVPGSGANDEGKAHVLDIVQRFIRAHRYDTMPWREAQDAGLLWAPLRKPHENVADEHWQ